MKPLYRRAAKRKCEWCSAEFVGRKDQRFCGGSCSGKWVASTRAGAMAFAAKAKGPDRECQWCGVMFWRKNIHFGRRGEGKYCSRRCGYFGRQIGKSCPIRCIVPPKRECASVKCSECDLVFVQRRRNHLVCSRACALTRGRRRYKESWRSVREKNPIVEHSCRECGKLFATNHYSAIRVFCSERCGDYYWKKELRDRNKIRDLAIGGTELLLDEMPVEFIEACIAYRRAQQEIWRIRHRATKH